MYKRDAAEIIEQDVLPTINTMVTTFTKVADIQKTPAAGGSVTGANQSGQQDGQKHAKENAQSLSNFSSNIVAPALQQALGIKASPSTPGVGRGSSGHRQGQ